MKTLRLVRNIAVLFLLAMALLASKPTVSQASNPNKHICTIPGKTGFNCNFDSNGNCFETKCVAGQPCENASCVAPPKPGKCIFFCK